MKSIRDSVFIVFNNLDTDGHINFSIVEKYDGAFNDLGSRLGELTRLKMGNIVESILGRRKILILKTLPELLVNAINFDNISYCTNTGVLYRLDKDGKAINVYNFVDKRHYPLSLRNLEPKRMSLAQLKKYTS